MSTNYQSTYNSSPASYHPYSDRVSYRARITAAKQELQAASICNDKVKQCINDYKAQHPARKRNLIGPFVISSKYYTPEEMSFQKDQLLPRIMELSAHANALRMQVDGIKRDYPGVGGMEVKGMGFAAWVTQKSVRLMLWGCERSQRKGKKVIEKRERKRK